jgi:type IV pilus assembly protein PilM
MADRNQSGSRPPLACEITAERVIAARASSQDRASLDTFSVRALPAGAVTPSLMPQNVSNGAALRQAIEGAMAAVSPRQRDVAVVLPDAAVPVVLMDFESLPEREQDAAPLVRFRLKKLLPFDAERALISYQASRSVTGVRVVVAVAMSAVVEEYEAAFRDVGFNPGVVLPSIVAALGAVDAAQPTLVIKVDVATTSVAIADQGELLLVRTVANGSSTVTPEELADDVYPLLVFFQDTYAARIQRVLVGGAWFGDALRAPLEQQTGVRVEELVSNGTGTTAIPRGALAGVVGALAG